MVYTCEDLQKVIEAVACQYERDFLSLGMSKVFNGDERLQLRYVLI